jgi:hypothetical protein
VVNHGFGMLDLSNPQTRNSKEAIRQDEQDLQDKELPKHTVDPVNPVKNPFESGQSLKVDSDTRLCIEV